MKSINDSVKKYRNFYEKFIIIVAALAVAVCAQQQSDEAFSDLPVVSDTDDAATAAVDEAARNMNLNAVGMMLEKNFKRMKKVEKDVIQKLLNLDNYELEYKVLNNMVNEIINIIEKQRNKLTNVVTSQLDDLSYLSTSNDDGTALQATLETTGHIVFLGELVHRAPDKMYRLMKSTDLAKNWQNTANWAYELTTRLKKLIEPAVTSRLRLAMQELHVVTRDDDYQGIGINDAATRKMKKSAIKMVRKKGPARTDL